MKRIRIRWPQGEVIASLLDTPTARKLLVALPCEASVNTWGEEVYFALPVSVALEADARQVVDPGVFRSSQRIGCLCTYVRPPLLPGLYLEFWICT